MQTVPCETKSLRLGWTESSTLATGEGLFTRYEGRHTKLTGRGELNWALVLFFLASSGHSEIKWVLDLQYRQNLVGETGLELARSPVKWVFPGRDADGAGVLGDWVDPAANTCGLAVR